MIERLGPAAQRHGLEKHANTKMIIELVGVESNRLRRRLESSPLLNFHAFRRKGDGLPLTILRNFELFSKGRWRVLNDGETAYR